MADLLKAGDIILLDKTHSASTDVPRHFLYRSSAGDFTLERALVKLDNQFAYLQGKYIVESTRMEGGSERECYPDGHHVYCRAVDSAVRLDFYQTGCFIGMNPEVKVIGRAKMTWSIIEEDASENS